MGDVFNDGSDGVPGHKRRVHDYTEAFDLEIGFVQGFEWATIVEVMVERYGEVRVCDGSDEHGVFGRRQE